MKLSRLFSGEAYKGTQNYLKTQRGYEIARTILYFAVSFSLFISGWITTGERTNLLTIVAILGCLPASKSAVEAIMFCRYQSLDPKIADQIQQAAGNLTSLYDMVFTGYQNTYVVNHIVVKGNTVCGFSEKKDFDEAGFSKHMTPLLKADSFCDVNVKIFTDLKKYLERLEHMQELSCDEKNTAGIAETLKNVSM